MKLNKNSNYFCYLCENVIFHMKAKIKSFSNSHPKFIIIQIDKSWNLNLIIVIIKQSYVAHSIGFPSQIYFYQNCCKFSG